MSNPVEELEFPASTQDDGMQNGKSDGIMEEILKNYDNDRNVNDKCSEFVQEISQSEVSTVINAAPGFVKIWDVKDTKLLNGKECRPDCIRTKILKYLDHSALLKLRLACKATYQVVSEFPAFLDHTSFLYLSEEAHFLFTESTVRWKSIRMAYWPSYIVLPRGNVLDTLLFWEEKGRDMEEIELVFQGGNPITRRILMDILPIPSNLKKLILHCNLSGIVMWSELEKQKLRKAMSKLVAFEVNGLSKFKVTQLVENQMLNLHIMASYIPKDQLTSFGLDDAFQDRPLFINMVNDFVIEVIRQHANSLRDFTFVQGTITSEAMLEICSFDNLKLSSISIDLLQTCHYFEKSEVGVLPTGLQQIQAWRAFVKLLHRSINLRKFAISLHRYNKKIGKKLFPQFIQETVQNLSLYSNVFENEASLQILTKFTNLRQLTLEEGTTAEAYGLRNGSLLLEDARTSFLATLPTTLASLTLSSLKEFGPTCLIVIVKRLPKLSSLKLHNCEKMVTDTSVQTLFQYGKNLTRLYLTPANSLTDEGISGKYNLGSLSGLVELSITHSKMTNFSLRKEIAFPQLETLDVSHNTRISARAISEVLTKLPNLYVLHIRGLEIPQAIAKKITAKYRQLCVFRNDNSTQVCDDNPGYYEYYNRWNYTEHISKFDECGAVNEILRNHNNSTIPTTNSEMPAPAHPPMVEVKPIPPPKQLRSKVGDRWRLTQEAQHIVELLNKLEEERRAATNDLELRQQEQAKLEKILSEFVSLTTEDENLKSTVDGVEKAKSELEPEPVPNPNQKESGAGDVPIESLPLSKSKDHHEVSEKED